jgi:hypothetical protein
MIIRISSSSIGDVQAMLNDENSETARAIWDALPIEARANVWGDEIYFSIPVKIGLENPKEVVELGDLGYWPPGSAFCIFFGKTPASRGDEIRPASPVNVFGRIIGDSTVFKAVSTGEKIFLSKAQLSPA